MQDDTGSIIPGTDTFGYEFQGITQFHKLF